MSIQKINIVLFGPGKVGSQLVNRILENQSLLLEEGKDIRISLVVSSSLVFIENNINKNTWDVTFIKSSKNERTNNIVSYIQDNELVNTIVVDASKSNELIDDYAYFFQNGFDVISVNGDAEKLSRKQSDEIKINSEVYGKEFFKLNNLLITQEQASEFAFQNILKISQNITQNTLVKQAI